ncbi:conserved hypothetical protein [Talaromyces stipitatus ATCC 10500]|uniref:15-O-acetyltransferase Tri3 n=1 Tax=Talaromyces stipitatus (strain ATCC 10500 / CBS 375.48 / QM 6759 / NRRL 1006) TaxID=441959 RepID=B8M0H8_TALSN|nr:uncharacterized protein TSTA_085060 [Talaromyces stipitatus ATCC 10500]EED21275.1 conserved hypothetical protein [Talaromyces stipitatus ATCC 10500]
MLISPEYLDLIARQTLNQFMILHTDPAIRQRRANGAEAIVGIEKSNAAVERALVKHRYEHPEIAQTALWEEGQIFPLIQYQAPKSNEDALAWAHEVVHVRASKETGLDIRTESEIKRFQAASGPAKAVVIDIVAPVDGLDTAIGSVNVEFVFHTNHLYFDGISKRIFVGDFFRYLTEVGDELPDFKWGEEVENLGAPVLTLWKEGVKTSGPEFDATLGQYAGIAMRGLQNYGLNPNQTTVSPESFSIPSPPRKVTQSTPYKSVKSKVGPTASPAHLGHAAVLLALLKKKPTTPGTPDNQIYMAQSPMNGRRFLRDAEKHAKTYYPIVQASCPVIFENIKQYNLVDADKETINKYLVQATKVAKDAYKTLLSNPYTLPVGTSFHNFVTMLIASNNIPETGISSPMYTSDGVNETYIDREVSDETGKVAITIDTVRFFLNQYMPFMSIRLDSFRGRSELSLSYNDGQYTDEEASTFLQDVASFILQFIQ